MTTPAADNGPGPLLEVRDLQVHFPLRGVGSGRRRVVRAVDGVSFAIDRGETLGLVGETGCGKSSAGRAVLQLNKPRAGEIWLDGQDLANAHGRRLRRMRREIQIIFQDPYASLNPRKTVAGILTEPLKIHRLAAGRERQERVRELLDLVGLHPRNASHYPHELSGGQRQRIGIARALAVEPSIIVCDEPISSLDVSVQAQVMNLLAELQARLGLTYLFIAHDLAAVRHVSNRVAVMYLGRFVEVGHTESMYDAPLHPYTRALLSAVPVPDPAVETSRRRILLGGDVPNPSNPPSGCRFNSRCPWAETDCKQAEPPLEEVRPGHWVACHFWREIEAGTKRMRHDAESFDIPSTQC